MRTQRNRLCACGSGIKFKRCCGRLIADAPMNLAAALKRRDLTDIETTRLHSFKGRRTLTSQDLKWLQSMSGR